MCVIMKLTAGVYTCTHVTYYIQISTECEVAIGACFHKTAKV